MDRFIRLKCIEQFLIHSRLNAHGIIIYLEIILNLHFSFFKCTPLFNQTKYSFSLPLQFYSQSVYIKLDNSLLI